MAKPNPENKYVRTVPATSIDVYDVLLAFNVTCPARQHAIKKLLCAGIRGKGDAIQDLKESIQAIERAVEIEFERTNDCSMNADKIAVGVILGSVDPSQLVAKTITRREIGDMAAQLDKEAQEKRATLDQNVKAAIDEAVTKALHRFALDFNRSQENRRD